MKIYGTLTQQEKNILSSPVSLAKYKKLLFAGDHKGIQQMLIWDAIFIPMVRTIVDEYPAYVLSMKHNFSMDDTNRYDVVDMTYFVKGFFKWCDKVHPGRYTSNEDFIIKHNLEEQVGWTDGTKGKIQTA